MRVRSAASALALAVTAALNVDDMAYLPSLIA
jgi:hypothetical protein